MDGAYVLPAGINKYTRLLLTFMEKFSHIDDKPIFTKYTTTEYAQTSKSQREHTSSSARKRYFGYYLHFHRLQGKYQDIFAGMYRLFTEIMAQTNIHVIDEVS